MIKPPIDLQDLRRRIYAKAKAEPSWRFWGLFVHVCKWETLDQAYWLAKKNNGAPGVDGVTFEAIEAGGVDIFLEQIRDELVKGTYRPLRNRKQAIPKDGGKVRVLSIPAIRDRVVQGALKLILEPVFEADFQDGSFGYRPKRTAHEAVHRVAEAIVRYKTRAIDIDLKAYFDNVRHQPLLAKVAARVDDADVMRLLKMILKASGKKGVPQGGVISPLLSNLYLNEVDRMLERAKEVTRRGRFTYLEYALCRRSGDPGGRLSAARLAAEGGGEATPRGAGQARRGGQRGEEPGGGPGEGGELRVPGLRVPPHPQPWRGVAGAVRAQAEEADGAAGEAQGDLPSLSIRAGGTGGSADQPDPPGLGELLRGRPLEPLLLVRPRLGGEEDAAAPDARPAAPGLRLAEVE
jgi:retron-type reverse transcriptase